MIGALDPNRSVELERSVEPEGSVALVSSAVALKATDPTPTSVVVGAFKPRYNYAWVLIALIVAFGVAFVVYDSLQK